MTRFGLTDTHHNASTGVRRAPAAQAEYELIEFASGAARHDFSLLQPLVDLLG
jgi:hypothetical protein